MNAFIYSCYDLLFLVKTCTAPANGTNTQAVIGTSFDYDTTYTYSCESGYEVDDNSDLTVTCTDSKDWDKSAPECKGM